MIVCITSKKEFVEGSDLLPITNDVFMDLFKFVISEDYPEHKGVVTWGWGTDNPTLGVLIENNHANPAA